MSERPLGYHAWDGGDKLCVCGHPVKGHRSEVDDSVVMGLWGVSINDTFTWVVCGVDGCDSP